MPMFLPGFSKQALSPLQDDKVRAELARAILDDDPTSFRTIVQAAYPELGREHRLFAVLVMRPEGMTTVMVDEAGQRIRGPGYTIAANTPIDFLNVDFGESEMTVTSGDEVWRTPYPPESSGDPIGRHDE
jgi:hypothetical protein